MPYYCRYHPLEHAAWFCPACKVMFCENCAPEDPEDPPGTPRECLLCKGQLTSLGRSHTAVPFWQRLMRFMQAPLGFLPLGIILPGLALPYMVPGLYGQAMLGFLYLVALLKYGLTVLELRADGDDSPLPPQGLADAENNKFVFGVSWRLGALVIAIGVLLTKSAFFGGLLAVLLCLVLPAMILAAASSRDSGAMFSMHGVLSAMLAMGVFYLLLCVLLLGLVVVLQSFVGLIAPILPEELGGGLRYVGLGYFLLVMLETCGYVVFQYQTQLDYVPLKHARARRSKVRPDFTRIRLDLMMKDGQFGKAVELLKNELSRKGVNMLTHERYHKLLWALNDNEALNKHAGPFFTMMLKNGRDAQALSLMRRYLSRNKEFRPDSPDIRLDLAKAFIAMNEYKMAMHLLSGMHKDAPHFVGLPEAYMLAAHVLSENLGLPQKGLALMEYLDGRYRGHPNYAEMRAMKDQLTAKVKAAAG